MLNFVQIDANTIINVNEIMYIDPQYDIDCEIKEYHIVMKDQHHFIINEEKAADILFLIKEWTGVVSYAD